MLKSALLLTILLIAQPVIAQNPFKNLPIRERIQRWREF
ncbi:MAG: hypothetical protein ACD_39C01878G0002, partial [uncultured bacterium]